MTQPVLPFLRYGQVLSWLKEDFGISRKETEKLIKTGIIKGKPLRKGGRDFYRKSQILEVLNGANDAPTEKGENKGT